MNPTDSSLQELASQTEITPRELNVPHKPHHFLTKKVAIVGIAFIVTALSALVGTYYVLQTEKTKIEDKQLRQTAPTPTPLQNDTESVACTMEAKLCSDGSYVSRQGPRCEFAACP